MPDALASPDPNPGRLPLPAAFTCSLINGDPDALCVHLTGELDIATAPQLELTLRDAQAHARLVVLDLSDLTFIDSAGVHAIVNATSHARAGARRLVVLPAAANVERLFTLTATHEYLERSAAAPAVAAAPAHQARRRRSSRLSNGGNFRGASAAKPARDVTTNLMTRAVAAVLWLRTAPASQSGSEPAVGTSAEAGATAHP